MMVYQAGFFAVLALYACGDPLGIALPLMVVGLGHLTFSAWRGLNEYRESNR